MALRAATTRCFPTTYHHRFTCDHSESHHGILVSEKNILNLDHPCARCDPRTAAGQARLANMRSWDRSTVPYVTEDGNVIMAPRGVKSFSDVLSIRRVGDGYVADVVGRDSAEGRAVNSIYGWEIGGRLAT